MKTQSNTTPSWINTLTEWLDTKFTIPNTKIKFGIDPIFSLFPVLGDFLTYFVSLIIIGTLRQRGASGELILRMLLNSSVDVIIGSVPLLGTIFDVGYKSNVKNLKLMKAFYEEGKYQGNGQYLLLVILLTILLTIGALIYLSIFLVKEVIEMFSSM